MKPISKKGHQKQDEPYLEKYGMANPHKHRPTGIANSPFECLECVIEQNIPRNGYKRYYGTEQNRRAKVFVEEICDDW
jgi:hypothetical protein